MSKTVLFGKVKDPELIVLIFRGQLQCRMGETRGSHRCSSAVLELEYSSDRHEGSLEDAGVDK